MKSIYIFFIRKNINMNITNTIVSSAMLATVSSTALAELPNALGRWNTS